MARVDAIVLLAGNYLERAPGAASLYRHRVSDTIILTNDGVFSSWSPKHDRNLYQIEWSEEELVRLGVPRRRIVKLPYYGSSTMYEALALKFYTERQGLKSLLLVTSDYHASRALWAYRRVFAGKAVLIDVSPVRSDAGITIILGEYVKLLYYKLRYGVLKLYPDMKEKNPPGKANIS